MRWKRSCRSRYRLRKSSRDARLVRNTVASRLIVGQAGASTAKQAAALAATAWDVGAVGRNHGLHTSNGGRVIAAELTLIKAGCAVTIPIGLHRADGLAGWRMHTQAVPNFDLRCRVGIYIIGPSCSCSLTHTAIVGSFHPRTGLMGPG